MVPGEPGALFRVDTWEEALIWTENYVIFLVARSDRVISDLPTDTLQGSAGILPSFHSLRKSLLSLTAKAISVFETHTITAYIFITMQLL